jgi:hypothetical protein
MLLRSSARSWRLVTLMALSMSLASPSALADVSPALDRVSLWFGGYFLNTEVALKAGDAGNNISTGKVDLTSGHETVDRARLDFLFLDSQGFSFDYYSLNHSNSQQLSHSFTYAGLPFELNTTLRGKLGFTAGSASYHWWFGSANDVVGVGLGGTYYKARLGIDGTIQLNSLSASGGASWDEGAVAPLATLAYKHAFSDSLRAYLDASGVKKNGGTLSGHIYDGRLGVEWFPWQNFGVGAEYGVTRIKLDHDGSGYSAALDIKLDGPSLFARMRF